MRQRIIQFLSHRTVALIWTIFIFILMVLPGKMFPDEGQTFVPNLDKLIHAFLFGSFVFLWSFYYAAKQVKFSRSGKIFIRILLIACVYGITMEYVQKYFIPNRDFDFLDIVADTAGAVSGFFIFRMTFDRFRNR